MEAACTSETSVDIQLRSQLYIPEDSKFHYFIYFSFFGAPKQWVPLNNGCPRHVASAHVPKCVSACKCRKTLFKCKCENYLMLCDNL
jgi:hypothetical protein